MRTRAITAVKLVAEGCIVKTKYAFFLASAVAVAFVTGYLIFSSVPMAIVWACGLCAVFLVCSYIHEDATAGKLFRVIFGAFIVLPCIAFAAISALHEISSHSFESSTRLFGLIQSLPPGIGSVLVFGLIAAFIGGFLMMLTRRRSGGK